MTPIEIPPEIGIAAISGLAASFSAYYAWRSTRISNKSLEIAENDHKNRHSGLSSYLIEGIAWDNEEGSRFVAFACSISNVSSSPLSIIRMNLHVHAFDNDGIVTEIVLSPEASDAPSIWELKPLSNPINLNARTTESGWLGYKVPNRIIDSMSIDRYEINFISSSGEKSSITSYLLQRISNGN